MKLISFNLLLLLIFIGCTASKKTDPIPTHETFDIVSKNVGETRVINVWIPENYKKSSDKLPVLYMADGGIQEDFPHIANTLSLLIASKKITPIILVGIENTQRRRDLTGPTEIEEDKKIAAIVGESQKFRTFIKEELFPEISRRYNVSNEKGIIGESLSGLFVMETFFLTPEMFDFYIAMDPSLWWNNHYLVRSTDIYLPKLTDTKKKLWFVTSNAKDIMQYTDELAQKMKSENLLNLKWMYSKELKETHGTIFRATKEKALIWTLNKN